ncbi:hypothetical protein M0P65_02465 [Candidatus Gracilibacteria bacterium]|nr:hypothetical protein [Candidatus Gracilibacteria bacterium]
MKETIKKSIIGAVVFFSTIVILSVAYALVGGLSTADKVGTGSGLTSTSWNRIVDGILDLDSRLNNFTFNSGNVGIGVTPTSKLQVNGDIKSTNTPKAWVAFNGETLAIYASYGVSSVTRASSYPAGAYKINFSTPLPDINYAVMGSCNARGYSGNSFTVEGNNISGNTYQGLFTTYAQVGCRVSSTNVNTNSNYVTAVIYDN